MPFQKGHKLAKGGKREGAGRPKARDIEVREEAAKVARRYIEAHVDPVLQNYLKLAKGWQETRFTLSGDSYEIFKYDGQTTRHFIDKILPDEQRTIPGPAVIQFVQFNNSNSVQLPAEGLPVTVLDQDGAGVQAGGDDLASQIRQGQNGIEFCNYANVPGKRG